MRMKLGFAVIPFVCLALAGCETWSFETPWTVDTVRIINATPQQIIVTAGDEVQVAYAGKLVEFKFPNPEGLSGGEIVVETHTCRFVYQLPYFSETYPWRSVSAGLLALQMEGDYKLYAIRPNAAKPERFTDFSQLQTEEFPVAPDEQDCNRV